MNLWWKQSLSRWRGALAAVVLFALTCTLLFPIALYGDIPLDTDTLLFFYPLRAAHTDDSLGLWNPYLFNGMPRDANPQAQLLYPPNAIFSLLDAGQGYAFLLLFHYWIAGVGMYVWLRRMNLSRTASLIGAIAFLGNTYWRCKITNLGLLEAVAWVPWLMAYFTSQKSGAWSGVYPCMAFLALIILVGVPHIVVYTLLFMLLWVMAASLLDRAALVVSWLRFGAIVSGALLLTAGMWLPALLYFPESIRESLPLDEALQGSIPLSDLWKVFLGGMSQPEVTRAEPWEGTVYAGATVLLLAAMGLWRTTCVFRRATVAAFVVGILLALGAQGGLFVLLHTWVPGWGSINLPNRALMLCALVLPIWAAFGIDALRDGEQRIVLPTWPLLGTAGVLLLVVITAMAQNPLLLETFRHTALTQTFDPERIADWVFALLNTCLWLGLSLALLVAITSRTIKPAIGFTILAALITIQSVQYNQRLFLQTMSVDELEQNSVARTLNETVSLSDGRVISFAPMIDIAPDVRSEDIFPVLMYRLPEAFRIADVQGYDPLMPRRHAELIRAWAGQDGSSDNPRTLRVEHLPEAMLHMLGVNTIVGYPDQEILYRGSMVVDQPGLVVSELDEPREVSSVRLRSVLLRGGNMQQMTPVGEVRVYSATDDYQAFPIRAGQESANQFTRYGDQYTRHRPAPVFRWLPVPSPFGYESAQQYHATFDLPEPTHIESIGVALTHPSVTISVLEMSYDWAGSPIHEQWEQQGKQPIWKRRHPIEPATITTDIRVFPPLDEMIAAIEAHEVGPLPVFVDAEREHASSADVDTPLQSSVTVSRPHSDRIEIEYEVDKPAILVINETFSPYWNATLFTHGDSQQHADVFRVNHSQMGVRVLPDADTLSLTYSPTPFYIGRWISIVSLVALLVGYGFHRSQRLNEAP